MSTQVTLGANGIPSDSVIVLSIFAPITLILIVALFHMYRQVLSLQQQVLSSTAELHCTQDKFAILSSRHTKDSTRHTDIPSPLDSIDEVLSTIEEPQHDPKQQRNAKNKINTNITPFQQNPDDPESIFKNIRPIGFTEAPFSRRALIPRQSQMADIISTIKFRKEIQPQFSFTGIEEYNYCWVIFSFHANTNIGTEKRYIKTLINPPRSPDQRYGIYATRTPHRHNNIGLSLAKIVSWDGKKGVLTCSGLDLLDGTPILDIKPVHPCEQDIFQQGEIMYPAFVRANHTHTVEWSSNAVDNLTLLVTQKKIRDYPYTTIDNFKTVLDDILMKQDPRSSWHKGKSHNEFTVELYHTYVELIFDKNVIAIQSVAPIPKDVVKQNRENLNMLSTL